VLAHVCNPHKRACRMRADVLQISHSATEAVLCLWVEGHEESYEFRCVSATKVWDAPAHCSIAPMLAAVGLNFTFTGAAGRAGRGTARAGQGGHGGPERAVRQI